MCPVTGEPLPLVCGLEDRAEPCATGPWERSLLSL